MQGLLEERPDFSGSWHKPRCPVFSGDIPAIKTVAYKPYNIVQYYGLWDVPSKEEHGPENSVCYFF